MDAATWMIEHRERRTVGQNNTSSSLFITGDHQTTLTTSTVVIEKNKNKNNYIFTIHHKFFNFKLKTV